MATLRTDDPILVVAAVRQEVSPFFLREREGVEILWTGIGQGRADKAVRGALRRRRYQRVISAGFAGGARPGFKVGDLVMASEVIDASSGRRFVVEELPSLKNGAAVAVGPFLTMGKALSEPRAKAEAGNRYGAIAVEMETSAVAAAASEMGVPWVALRAILDPMEVPLAVGSRRQALWMLAAPPQWRSLGRFLSSVQTAGRKLAVGLQALI